MAADPARAPDVQPAAGAGPVRLGAATDAGLIRRENEDCVVAVTGTGGLDALVVVADGMGGHAAGRLASSLAVDAFAAHIEHDGQSGATPARLHAALEAANAAVLGAARQDSARAGMGCTLVAAALGGGRVAVVNVGDSPAYLVRARKLRVLSQDHSWPAEQARLGVISEDEAKDHPLKHRLTRAVGVWEHVQAYSTDMELRAGDVIALCTDGVETASVGLDELREVLSTTAPELAPDEVVARCLERGAPDNVTMAVALVG
ncbi:MAG: PP2C family protein-serine/threonine phosphatase [Candidatus Dormibacterales bacterium]